MAARVLVVDDHPVVRSGIVSLIDAHPRLRVVDAVGELSAARKRLGTQIDLLLCDVSLPDGSGLILVREAREAHPELGILVFSFHDELLYAERALRAGADGYLSKSEPPEAVVEGLLRVLDGFTAVSREVEARVASRQDDEGVPTSPADRLSDRELEIFELTGRGHGTRKVAELLGISVKTVETHKSNIRAKLGLADAGQLMRSAVAWLGEVEHTGA
jgi:DNA-binding NarL/FixJ family response regulator